ncbi:MAG: flagellar biosynthesis protein FlhB [Clostridiales bacterium]|nr:flagellar biosynthesis protein FlhB [Clostridiales bacterium]
MANGGAGEKTEKPTPKKRKDERKEGRILQSKEVVTAVSLIAVYYAFKLIYPITSQTLIKSIKTCFSLTETQERLKASDIRLLFLNGALTILIASLPMLLIAGLSTVLPTIAQTKAFISFKSIKFKFSKLNPLSGIKKMISLKGVMELLKAILKVTVLVTITYNTLREIISIFPKMMDMSVNQAVYLTGNMIFTVVKNIAIIFAFLAFFDFLYQRWDFEKNLKMTKQEIKEEYKQSEGDPQIKGKIRQIQRQRSMNRMMQAVPEADVIIRNPTHYAVALKYDSEDNNAPILVAKGADFVALKIIEIAKNNDIIITENKPLARALYAAVDIGGEIPKDFYQAVADVLAYVYSVKKKELK